MRIRFGIGTAFWVSAVAACTREAAPPAPPSAETAAVTSDTSRADALLLAASKIALPPDLAPEDLPDPHSPPAILLVRYCAQCHAVPSPAMHSATDWPRILRRMWLRMDMLPDTFRVAIPDLGERATLLRYLNDNALRVSGAALPAGPGREAFAELCSRCHTLPDPRVHSPKDWPAVFMRMEQNMDRMHVRRPIREETDAILTYLQGLPPAAR